MKDSIKREQSQTSLNSAERENLRPESKQIETIATGKNFSAVSVGKMNEIIEHVLPMGPEVTIQGKVFAGQAVGATGSENYRSRHWFPDRTAVSCTPIRPTRNCISSSRVRASIK